MTTPISRSKKEIIRDVETNRAEIRRSFQSAKKSVTRDNAVVRAWKKTRQTAQSTARRVADGTRCVVAKVKQGDDAVRRHPYRTVFASLAAGAAVGLVMGWRHRRSRRSLPS